MHDITPSTSRLGCMVVLMLALAPLPTLGATTNEEIEFDLQGGPLGDTLLAIARQAGEVISFKPGLVDPHTAPPIRGRFTLLRALTLATQAAGLAIEITPGGAVTVLPAAPAAAAGPPPDAPVSPTGAPGPPAAVLPPVVVLGSGLPRQADGLRALRGWSATRSDTPLADLPQTVSVLTSEALALQGAATSTEALNYVVGVDASIANDASGGFQVANLLVRGLPAGYALSGMRTLRGFFPVETALIERIEVPKGPSGVIGGIADVGGRGGLVNLVRKQAGPGLATELSQSLSSQDSGTLRLGADTGGQLGLGPTWWRVIGYGSRTGGTEGGYDGQNSTGLLTTLTHQGQDLRATFTLQADLRRSTPAPSGRGGELQPDGSFTPVQPGLVEPVDPGDRVLARFADVEADLDWRFAPGWRTTWKGRIEGLRTDTHRIQPFTVPVDRRKKAWNAGMQWGLVRDISTGPAAHQVLLGLDLERSRSVEDGVNLRGVDPNDVLTLDTREFKQALLLQDQISLGRLRLRLAVQRARTPLFNEDNRGAFNFVSGRQLATNWDAGALLKVNEWASVYGGAQYAIQTDRRIAGLLLDDGSLPPDTKLQQFQAGAKFQLAERRVELGVEAFRLRQDDQLIRLDGAVPGRSVDGMELELAGRPRPGLDLRMGLSLTRANDFVPDNTGTAGIRIPAAGVPWGSLHLLGTWQLPQALLGSSRLTVGYRAQSSKWVVAPNPQVPQAQLNLPGGARLDLALDRLVGPVTLSVFVRNMFDRQTYGPVSDPRYLPLEPGRSVGLMAVYRDN